MKEQRITIEIDPDGKMTADAEGFTGDACLRDIDKLLDGITAAREETSRKADDANAKVKVHAGNKVVVGRKT